MKEMGKWVKSFVKHAMKPSSFSMRRKLPFCTESVRDAMVRRTIAIMNNIFCWFYPVTISVRTFFYSNESFAGQNMFLYVIFNIMFMTVC